MKRYSKTCVKRPPSKRPKIGFQDQLSLNAGQKYCRMLQGEHSAILSTFIKLPYVIKIFVLIIFEWLFYTGFTVHCDHFATSSACVKGSTALSAHVYSIQVSMRYACHCRKILGSTVDTLSGSYPELF